MATGPQKDDSSTLFTWTIEKKKGSEGKKKLFMKPLIWPEINGLVTFQRDAPQFECNTREKKKTVENK